MSECPMQGQVRSGLPQMPERIAKLPVDERGYPVPYFAAWVEGKPDFRIADDKKFNECLFRHGCWVCGEQMGRYSTFLIGPMCTVTRTTAEPPMHLDCAEWSALACPFLTRPNMVRREDEVTAAHEENVAGIMIKRNPGVVALWTTRSYGLKPDHKGGVLIEVGEPESVSWFKEGRAATREEVIESMASGLPALEQLCRGEAEHTALKEAVKLAARYLPLQITGEGYVV